MIVDYHILIFLEWWTVTFFVKFDVFPRNLWGAFGIADTLCWKTAKLAMNVATCCRSSWLRESNTANGGATKQINSGTKRNPDQQSLRIALE
jgi:hypothetical protein